MRKNNFKLKKAYCEYCGENNGEFIMGTNIRCVKCGKYFILTAKIKK